MNIVKQKGMLFLETNYTTGNKAWCARITGLDTKYKFVREFFNKTRQGFRTHEINEGDIIEEVVYSHSGKNRSQKFYIVSDGALVETSERHVIYNFTDFSRSE